MVKYQLKSFKEIANNSETNFRILIRQGHIPYFQIHIFNDDLKGMMVIYMVCY